MKHLFTSPCNYSRHRCSWALSYPFLIVFISSLEALKWLVFKSDNRTIEMHTFRSVVMNGWRIVFYMFCWMAEQAPTSHMVVVRPLETFTSPPWTNLSKFGIILHNSMPLPHHFYCRYISWYWPFNFWSMLF